MLINGITFSKLRNSEFAQFTSDALELIRRNDPEALQVKAAYDDLKAGNDELNTLLNPDKGSALTGQIEAADDRRDRSVTGINLVAEGYTYHFDDALRTHALTLQRHLTLFGGASLARENYQAETASISLLVADLTDKPELAAAVNALGLSTWITELSQANKAFNDLYLSRTEEASTANLTKVRDLRKDMIQRYFKLRDRIASFYNIQEGAAPYSTVVSQLNILIGKYNDLLNGRKSSGSSTEQ